MHKLSSLTTFQSQSLDKFYSLFPMGDSGLPQQTLRLWWLFMLIHPLMERINTGLYNEININGLKEEDHVSNSYFVSI